MLSLLLALLIGVAGFLIALPLDAIVIAIKEKNDRRKKPTLASRLEARTVKVGAKATQGAINVGKKVGNVAVSLASLKGEGGLGSPSTRAKAKAKASKNAKANKNTKADKTTKNNIKTGKNNEGKNKDNDPNKKKEDEAKDKDPLKESEDESALDIINSTSSTEVAFMLDEAKTRVKMAPFKALSAFVKWGSKILSSLVMSLGIIFEVILVLMLIVAIIVGYILGYTNMYVNTIKQQATVNASDGTKRKIKQGSDYAVSETAVANTNNLTDSLWGSFINFEDTGIDDNNDDPVETIERGDDTPGVIENPDVPGVDPEPGEEVIITESLHVPYTKKSGGLPSNKWHTVKFSDGSEHVFEGQHNNECTYTLPDGSLCYWGKSNVQGNNNCCALVALAAIINLKSSNYISFNDIMANYINKGYSDLTTVGDGGASTNWKNLIDSTLGTNCSIKKLGGSEYANSGHTVVNGVNTSTWASQVDNSLANGCPVVTYSVGGKSKGLSAGSAHWITIVGKTQEGYYEVLCNGTDEDTTPGARDGITGKRSAYYTAETLSSLCRAFYTVTGL